MPIHELLILFLSNLAVHIPEFHLIIFWNFWKELRVEHTADISKFLYPKNVSKNLKNMSNFVNIFWSKKINENMEFIQNFSCQKILTKAQVFSSFFDSWGCTGWYSLLQFTPSKNAKETCAFLKIFWIWKFLNKSHIFPWFLGSKKVDIMRHIFKIFWSIFWSRKLWDVCSGMVPNISDDCAWELCIDSRISFSSCFELKLIEECISMTDTLSQTMMNMYSAEFSPCSIFVRGRLRRKTGVGGFGGGSELSYRICGRG